MTHYWDMETVGLSRRRAEIAYRAFGWAVRLLGGEIAGGGYGDVPPVETIPIKTEIEAMAIKGPTKLCRECGRFMAIDSARRMLPHTRLMSDEPCLDETGS